MFQMEMCMKPLTKAEEQVMQQVWKLSSAYLKDIVESYPTPRPHTNTVATLVKILVDKGYIGVEAMGRVHRYFPLVSKEAYSTNSIKSLVDAYFEGSFSEAVSCMLQQKEISVHELELLLNQLKQSKK